MTQGETAAEAREDDDVAPMTTAMLKALSHPLRQRLVHLLRRQRHLRAADAAAELGEPANKISFHLRVLADAGLIQEDPTKARDRRDRVWTARERAWELGSAEHPVADEALGTTVLHSLVAEHQDLVRRFASWAPEYVTGRDTGVHGTFTRSSVHLTPAEFEKLMTLVHAAIRDAEETHAEDDPETRFFQIDIIAIDDTL